jgi:hypothetical protein
VAFDFAEDASLVVADDKLCDFFELPAEIPERGGLCDVKIRCGAGDAACGEAGLVDGMQGGGGEGQREGAEKSVQAFVDAADTFEAGDGFLPDVAAFVKIDGVCLEAGFLGQGVLGDFEAPCGLAVEDAEEGESAGGGGGKVGRFLSGVVARLPCAVDAEGSVGWLDAEDVVEGSWHLQGLEAGIVCNEIALEAGVNGFGEGFVALDEEIFPVAPDLQKGAEFSFCGEEAGWACGEGLESGDVDAHLAIEVARGVGAAELESGAGVNLEKA